MKTSKVKSLITGKLQIVQNYYLPEKYGYYGVYLGTGFYEHDLRAETVATLSDEGAVNLLHHLNDPKAKYLPTADSESELVKSLFYSQIPWVQKTYCPSENNHPKFSEVSSEVSSKVPLIRVSYTTLGSFEILPMEQMRDDPNFKYPHKSYSPEILTNFRTFLGCKSKDCIPGDQIRRWRILGQKFFDMKSHANVTCYYGEGFNIRDWIWEDPAVFFSDVFVVSKLRNIPAGVLHQIGERKIRFCIGEC